MNHFNLRFYFLVKILSFILLSEILRWSELLKPHKVSR